MPKFDKSKEASLRVFPHVCNPRAFDPDTWTGSQMSLYFRYMHAQLQGAHVLCLLCAPVHHVTDRQHLFLV
jgi:hypothetical protein